MRSEHNTKVRKSDGVIAKQFPTLFSAAIAFAGVAISATNIWVAYIGKSKDLDIANQKDFREFVTKNRATIYGSDYMAAEQLRNVMRITFPKDLWEPAFQLIEVNAPRNTMDLYSTNVVQTRVFSGRVGTWGGPNDMGVAPDEGLSLIAASELSNFAEYFLSVQPPGTTGLARRLNINSFYISARWNYAETPKSYLKSHLVTVTNRKTGKSAKAQPIDWGPPAQTGRIADLSPGLAKEIGVSVDDEVTIEIQ